MFFKKKAKPIVIKMFGREPFDSTENARKTKHNPLIKIGEIEPLKMSPQQREKNNDKPVSTINLMPNYGEKINDGLHIKLRKRTGNSYAVIMHSSILNRKAETKFTVPYDDKTVDAILRELEHSLMRQGANLRAVVSSSTTYETSTTRESQEVPLLEQIGFDLFGSLFNTDEMLELYLETARQYTSHFPISVDTEDFKVERLPWELLFDGHRFLCRDIGPIFRVVPGSFPGVSTIKKPGDLKILVIPIAPVDQSPIDYSNEVADIFDSLKNTGNRVETPHRQDLDTVRQKILESKADIVHFIGHGDLGELLFRDQSGKSVPVSEALVALFSALIVKPQLIIFNACNSGQTNVIGNKKSISERLIENRIPLVVAMQFLISDSAAKAFSKGFYEHVATGESLHRAVAWGRVAIMMSPELQGSKNYEWATPVVFANPAVKLT